jgi:hypothetical protein
MGALRVFEPHRLLDGLQSIVGGALKIAAFYDSVFDPP